MLGATPLSRFGPGPTLWLLGPVSPLTYCLVKGSLSHFSVRGPLSHC